MTIDNTIALQVRPPAAPQGFDLATPLLAAAKMRQADIQSQATEFQHRQAVIGSEARGLIPYVEHPEFGARWAEATDRLAQQGALDPQTHARIRNTPSPLLLQQILAQTDTPEVSLQRQKLGSQQSAENEHAATFGLPTRRVPGVLPGVAAPMGAPPAASDPTMTVSPRQVAQANGAPAPQTQSQAQPIAWGDGVVTTPGAPQSQAPQAQAAPQQSPQVDRLVSQLSPAAQKYFKIAADPRLPKDHPMHTAAMEGLKAELANAKITDDTKKYLEARALGDPAALSQTPTEWMTAYKRAGSTQVSIDQKGESAFEAEFGKVEAKRWNGYITAADAAQNKQVDIDNLREIGRRLGSQGVAANVKEFLGPYAEAMGVNIDGLSDIQAYSSIIQRLAPQQRAPGSGATSDIEYKGFLKALPALSQHPGAREITIDTMHAINLDDIKRGEIAGRLAAKELTRVQAERELRALPDPMAGFRDWKKANSPIYTAALKQEAPRGEKPATFNDRFSGQQKTSTGLGFRFLD